MARTKLTHLLLLAAIVLTGAPCAAATPASSCGAPAVARYIEKMYKGKKPFASLRPESQELVCSQVGAALERYNQNLPALREKFAAIQKQNQDFLILEMLADGHRGDTETKAREALSGPAILQGGRAPARDAGSLNQFALQMADLLPIVRFNVEDEEGYRAVPAPGPYDSAFDKQSLETLAHHVKWFAPDEGHDPKRPEHCVADMWTAVRDVAERLAKSSPVLFVVDPRVKADLSRFKLIQEGGGSGKPNVILLNRAAKDGSFVFDNEAQRVALMGAPDQPDRRVIRGSDGRSLTWVKKPDDWNTNPHQVANPLLNALGVKESPFLSIQPATRQRPLDIPSMPSLSPWSGERKKTMSDSGASDLLIARYGSAKEALGAIITARGGDNSEVPFPERIRALRQIRDTLPGLTFKDPNSDASVDEDLMHLDHYLNAYAAVRSVATPDDSNWWITKKAKTVYRSAVGFVSAGVTTGYEGVKAFDQSTGWGTGKLVGYDFNAPQASRASVSGWWSGVKGCFTGSFDEEK